MNWHDIIAACRDAAAFVKELYELWPMPWIFIVTSLSATLLGYQTVKFIRAGVQQFSPVRISDSRLLWYATCFAFGFALAVGELFEALQDKPLALLLHAIAAAGVCAPIVKGGLAKLRARDPALADAIDHALDTTQEINQQQAGVKPNGG